MLLRFGKARSLAAGPIPIHTDEAAWASADIALWNDRGVTAERVAAEAARLNAAAPTIYVLQIAGPKVTIAPKAETPEFSKPFRFRAETYRRLLEDVVRVCGLDINAPMILEASDQVASVSDMPIIGFQRTEGADTLLLPDVELIERFNVSADVQDDIPWESKRPGAVFTGSTTGAWSNEHSVRVRALPRIAAAEHFRGSPRVRWELPNVVQCVNAETVELIRSLGFGAARRTWREQFGHRVLLSMDGNGAACSRVSIGLASRCLLAKFQSTEMLYYFRALKAGEHYVALADCADVDRLLDDLEARPHAYKAIADAGRVFAHRYLTRVAVYAYVAEFLIRYARLLKGERVEANGEALARRSFEAELVATFDDGSRRLGALNGWAGSPRSGRLVKRLLLQLAPGLPNDAIRLVGLGASSVAASTSLIGEIHAGDGGPLYGVGVEVADSSAAILDVTLEATFLDGHTCAVRGSGVMASSPRGAPLEAAKLSVARR